MTTVLGWARRARAASIWGPGNVGSGDARVARLLRRTIPEFYIAMWLFGSLGVLGRVPALRDTFGEDYAVVAGFAIATASLAALLGTGWPSRFWRIELYAVSLLSGLLLLYAGSVLLAAGSIGDLGRMAVAPAVFAMSTFTRWRITDIARERRKHGWN
jgi:hypothetical protein